MTALPHAIRRARPSDAGFLVSSWLKSYQAVCTAAEKRSGYAIAQREVIACLLETSTVLIATAEDDDDVLYGWVCCEMSHGALHVHYIYVKAVYRRARVARSLFEAARKRLGADGANVVCTHMTYSGLAEKVEDLGWGRSYRLPMIRALAQKGTR